MTAPSSTRCRKPVSGRRRLLLILLSVGLGIIGSALIGELGLRLWLGYLFRKTIDDVGRETLHDPNRDLYFSDLIRPDADPKLVFRMKAGVVGKFLHRPLQLNSAGFRGPELSDPKTSRTIRIACLGDSTLFGWEVEEQQRYANVLQGRLQKAFGEGWRIETVDLGIPAYNSVQEVEMFDVERARVKPDAVVIQFDPNDYFLASFLRKRRIFRLDRFYLLHLREVLNGEMVLKEFWDQGGDFFKPEYAKLDGAVPMLDAYRHLIEECRGLKIPVVTALSFWDVDGPDGEHRMDPQDVIRKLCSAMKVPIADPYPLVQSAAAANGQRFKDYMMHYPQDLHPTVDGHALIADALFPPVFRAIAAGRLDDAKTSAALSRFEAETSSRRVDFGFFPAEDWNGVSVQWTGLKAQRVFSGAGKELEARYLVRDPSISPERPLKLVFQLEGEPPREIEQTKPGFYEEHFDASNLKGGTHWLTISVDRTFDENGDLPAGRNLGVALYPLEMDSKPLAGP